MHFYLVALEQAETYHPTLHVAWEEKLSWLKVEDALPKHQGPDYLNQ